MPPKPPIPDSPSSSSASESASSDEEQETAVTQPAPPSRKPAPIAKPPASDDEDSGSDEDEEEDEEGSDDSDSPAKPGKPAGKVEVASAVKAPVEDSSSESGSGSGSESESSESIPKPPSPRRLSREADSSAKPISSIPKDSKMTGKKPSPEKPKMPVTSAVGAEKRKRQVLENREEGEAAANGSYAKKRKRGGLPSRSTGRSAEPNKRLVVGGEAVESEAEVLYPCLQDAIHLLEMEGGNILMKGSMVKAIALLNPAEANALEGQWKKHLAAGVRYFMERAALKEDLLKSLVGVLEGK